MAEDDISQSPSKKAAKIATYISQVPDSYRKQEEQTIGTLQLDKVINEVTAFGFNLKEELEARTGPFIEIAGPTPEGFEFVDYDKLDRKVFISNIGNGLPLQDDEKGEIIGHWGKVDFQADSQKMPLRQQSVGALFASKMDIDVVIDTIKEANRILEPGGIFILQGVTKKDIIDLVKELGFEVKREVTKENRDGLKIRDLILQNPIKK